MYLKKKLFQIMTSSKIIEECMIHIDRSIDKWPIKNFNEQEIYSSVSDDDGITEGELLGNPTMAEKESSKRLGSSKTAEQEKLQNILNQIVASVSADVKDFCEVTHKKILRAFIENIDEETDLVRSYILSTTLEDIGEAEAIKLSSTTEFEFLKPCNDRCAYLCDLMGFMANLEEMMRDWDKQLYELVRAWVEASSPNQDNLHGTQSDSD